MKKNAEITMETIFIYGLIALVVVSGIGGIIYFIDHPQDPQTFCTQCLDDWTADCDAECLCLEKGCVPGSFEEACKLAERFAEEWRTKYNSLDCQESDDVCHIVKNHAHATSLEFESYAKPYRKCNKARPLNECDKGNPDYIIVQKCNESMYPAYVEGIGVFCETQKVCRKKTLQDYSCGELKKQILKGENYCEFNNKWSSDQKLCWLTWMSTKDLAEHYTSKGCPI